MVVNTDYSNMKVNVYRGNLHGLKNFPCGQFLFECNAMQFLQSATEAQFDMEAGKFDMRHG